ncbi:hypothetical protein COU57_02835 [Candidatus Pacearchaeota archaeon CG10_big_fil_rev_8_21_14_0_10_32_14]|nr:MAG: hypothetical protein COU57_02835 [Candidatus Pacearchaeota archaeon CG10_big_fil_rev_8_21_14_0_10_32_14]
MAKVSPVSIKYMIHVNFEAEGALEKPDVIGAIFGQTEGLLGNDLEMRELQKEGKIGRIEVDLERKDKKTVGKIQIPTALDQSETTLIAAAIETIERIGPCDSQLEVVKIEDVRGTKRDYIIERAKKLMKEIEGSTDSREISNTIKESSKTSEIGEYGDEKLPCGDLSDNEIIVVEGRADVLNLLRNDVKNVIAMNGTKLPNAINELGQKKELTLFVDGDRGGKLIVKNVTDNAKIAYIAVAPDGKEVEELQKKEILIALRKRVPSKEFIIREDGFSSQTRSSSFSSQRELNQGDKVKLKELYDGNQKSGKALLLNENLEIMKDVSVKSLASALQRLKLQDPIFTIIADGTVNGNIIGSAEERGVKVIVAKNFTTADTKISLLSF